MVVFQNNLETLIQNFFVKLFFNKKPTTFRQEGGIIPAFWASENGFLLFITRL